LENNGPGIGQEGLKLLRNLKAEKKCPKRNFGKKIAS
jgi:hypothetical protein